MSARKTILLVDENRTSSLYLGIILKRMGFDVNQACSGREALKLLKQARPDLILIEAGMSALSGPDTLKAIRKDRKNATVPVVMLSENMDEALIRRCEEAGSNGFLSRPVRMDELHEILQEFVFRVDGFRRRYMRVNARIKVMLFKDGMARQFITETVSERGLYLRTDNTYPVLSEVEVSLPAPDLKVKGLVIYHRGISGDNASVPPGMAVEFIGLRDGEPAALRMFVAGLMTGDMGRESEDTVSRLERGCDGQLSWHGAA